jgi:hypothetical protein
MFFFALASLLSWIVDLATLRFRSNRAKEREILLLHRQLAILRRCQVRSSRCAPKCERGMGPRGPIPRCACVVAMPACAANAGTVCPDAGSEEAASCCPNAPRGAGPASCTRPPGPSTCPAHADEDRRPCSIAALCLAGVDIPGGLPCARPPGSICRLCPTGIRRVYGCRGIQVATEADQAPVPISNLLHEPREPIR